MHSQLWSRIFCAETHFKCREISFCPNKFLNFQIVLKFRQKCGSTTDVLCEQYQNDLPTVVDATDRRDFARFEFKMSLTQFPLDKMAADYIFRCIFMNEKFCILIKISLKFVPKGPIDINPGFGLDDGLAPHRRQAIIWTNADPIHWRIYAALGGGGISWEGYPILQKPPCSVLIETSLWITTTSEFKLISCTWILFSSQNHHPITWWTPYFHLLKYKALS